jgi:hypothetical protein
VLNVNKSVLFARKTTNKSHLTIFNSSQCFMISKTEPHKIIAQGVKSSKNGLYKLVDRKPHINPKEHQALSLEKTNIVRLWYIRLRRLNF